jgi:hypothetical protein
MIEWGTEGPMANQNYHLEVLSKLRKQVGKKRLELWKKKSQIPHEDNAPAHNALAMKLLLADECIPVLEHPHIHWI